MTNRLVTRAIGDDSYRFSARSFKRLGINRATVLVPIVVVVRVSLQPEVIRLCPLVALIVLILLLATGLLVTVPAADPDAAAHGAAWSCCGLTRTLTSPRPNAELMARDTTRAKAAIISSFFMLTSKIKVLIIFGEFRAASRFALVEWISMRHIL